MLSIGFQFPFNVQPLKYGTERSIKDEVIRESSSHCRLTSPHNWLRNERKVKWDEDTLRKERFQVMIRLPSPLIIVSFPLFPIRTMLTGAGSEMRLWWGRNNPWDSLSYNIYYKRNTVREELSEWIECQDDLHHHRLFVSRYQYSRPGRSTLAP